MLTQIFSNIPATELLNENTILAVMPFVGDCEPAVPGIIHSGLSALDAAKTTEAWVVDDVVTRGSTGECHWSKTSDLICVAYWINVAILDNLENEVCLAYRAVFSVFEEQGFKHPFRFWNYVPNINHGDGDKEIYKRFCAGRLQAFEQLQLQPESFPSASALGHHVQDRAVVYGFASAIEPIHLGNTKQVHAYDYPTQYGSSSPSFTRATTLSLAGSPFLFISGTASITGHETVESGNLEGQLEVTLSNINHLLETANPYNTKLSTFKVYLRHSDHYTFTRNWLQERYPDVDVVITLADVCRLDLLVEIECFCR